MGLHCKVEEPTLPMKRLSMRKLKEVLRLRYELGLGQRQIARSCSIGHGTVYEYLKRAQAAGVTWPLPEGWGFAAGGHTGGGLSEIMLRSVK